MNRPHHAGLALAAALLTAGIGASSASAQVSLFTDATSFLGATTTSLYVTFESATMVNQSLASYTENGVTFAPLPDGGPLYIATPGGAGAGNFNLPLESNVLTGNGEDRFYFSFFTGGGGSHAIGFDVYTNQYEAPTVNLYDTSGDLLQSVVLSQTPSTLGFFGAMSTEAIGRVEFVAVGGAVKNAGVDNVRMGEVVPEPMSMLLLGTGLLGVGFVARRRRESEEG